MSAFFGDLAAPSLSPGSQRFVVVGRPSATTPTPVVVWGIDITAAAALKNAQNEVRFLGLDPSALALEAHALSDEEAAAVMIGGPLGTVGWPVVGVTCAPCTAHADCEVDRVFGLACAAERARESIATHEGVS